MFRFSIFQNPNQSLPDEIFISFVLNANNKDILSLLLCSRGLAEWLKKDRLWKTLISPQFDVQHNKFIRDNEYQLIWRKRALLNIDLDKMQLKHAMTDIASMYNHGYIKLQNLIGIQYLCYKKVNRENLYRFLKEDNDIELFWEASRIGCLYDAILGNDASLASELSKDIDKELSSNNDSLASQLNIADFNFTLYLMPYILDVHANKCFDLFVRTFFMGYTISVKVARDLFQDVGFQILQDIIFTSNNRYFICRLIELTFLYSDEVSFLKKVVLASVKHDVEDLLLNALNKIEKLTEVYESLIKDEAVVHILMQNKYFYQRVLYNQRNREQLEQAYESAKAKYLEYQNEIEYASQDNPESLECMLEYSKILEMRMIEKKSAWEGFEPKEFDWEEPADDTAASVGWIRRSLP